MILMPQIFDVIANENARYKRNELEFKILIRLKKKNRIDVISKIFAKKCKWMADKAVSVDGGEENYNDMCLKSYNSWWLVTWYCLKFNCCPLIYIRTDDVM